MIRIVDEQSPLGEFRRHLIEWPAGMIAAEMQSDPDFAAIMESRLPPELFQSIVTSPRTDALLGQDDLRELIGVLGDASCVDVALTKVHDSSSLPGYLDARICIGEISKHLGMHSADAFAERCADFTNRLTERMRLEEAVEIIAEWIAEVEDIQRAMDQQIEQVTDSPSAAQIIPDRDVYDTKEAAAYLGFGNLKRPDNKLQQLIKNRDLPRRKIGGRLIFRREDLDRLKEHGSRRSRRGRPPGSRNRPC